MSDFVYVDTGAWLALLRPRDTHHARIAKHFRSLRRARALMVTSDAVISETVTRLRYDSGSAAVQTFRSLLDDAVEEGALRIRESSPELRAKAFDLIARYQDVSLSYADAMGAAIARVERVDGVFGLDGDFRVLGFMLEP